MDIQLSIPVRANRSMLWLLVAALILCLILALNAALLSVVWQAEPPASISPGQAIPQVVPVPEPPDSQLAADPQGGAAPVLPRAQISPVLQPVPMAPAVP